MGLRLGPISALASSVTLVRRYCSAGRADGCLADSVSGVVFADSVAVVLPGLTPERERGAKAWTDGPSLSGKAGGKALAPSSLPVPAPALYPIIVPDAGKEDGV